jgi:hypothetical protein
MDLRVMSPTSYQTALPRVVLITVTELTIIRQPPIQDPILGLSLGD